MMMMASSGLSLSRADDGRSHELAGWGVGMAPGGLLGSGGPLSGGASHHGLVSHAPHHDDTRSIQPSPSHEDRVAGDMLVHPSSSFFGDFGAWPDPTSLSLEPGRLSVDAPMPPAMLDVTNPDDAGQHDLHGAGMAAMAPAAAMMLAGPPEPMAAAMMDAARQSGLPDYATSAAWLNICNGLPPPPPPTLPKEAPKLNGSALAAQRAMEQMLRSTVPRMGDGVSEAMVAAGASSNQSHLLPSARMPVTRVPSTDSIGGLPATAHPLSQPTEPQTLPRPPLAAHAMSDRGGASSAIAAAHAPTLISNLPPSVTAPLALPVRSGSATSDTSSLHSHAITPAMAVAAPMGTQLATPLATPLPSMPPSAPAMAPAIAMPIPTGISNGRHSALEAMSAASRTAANRSLAAVAAQQPSPRDAAASATAALTLGPQMSSAYSSAGASAFNSATSSTRGALDLMAASVAASAAGCNRAAMDAVAASVAAGGPPNGGLPSGGAEWLPSGGLPPHPPQPTLPVAHAIGTAEPTPASAVEATNAALLSAAAAASGGGLCAGHTELSWSHAADLVNAVLSTARQRYSMSMGSEPFGGGRQLVSNSVAAVAAAQQQQPGQPPQLPAYRHLVPAGPPAAGPPAPPAAPPARAAQPSAASSAAPAPAPALPQHEATPAMVATLGGTPGAIGTGLLAGPGAPILTHRPPRRDEQPEPPASALPRPNQLLEQQQQIRRILQHAAAQAQQQVQQQAAHQQAAHQAAQALSVHQQHAAHQQQQQAHVAAVQQLHQQAAAAQQSQQVAAQQAAVHQQAQKLAQQLAQAQAQQAVQQAQQQAATPSAAQAVPPQL